MEVSIIFRSFFRNPRFGDARDLKRSILAGAVVLACVGVAMAPGKVRAAPAPTAHLTFQIFTDGNPQLWNAPKLFAGAQPQQMNFAVASKQQISATVRDLVARIGTTGTPSHKLGFIVGPVSLEYTDAQIRTLIRNAFEVAQEEQVAVGFHIDDSMFWYRRRELWEDSRNVEWLDWSGTPNTGRRIDWSPGGVRLAPQMCYNARDIVSEVTRVARHVIGAEIQLGIAEVGRINRPELFAGVIVGWESQLGKDFVTGRTLGFCALSNKGYSQAQPPVDIDAEREKIVRTFIELWSSSLASAGIDSRKLYSHTAFVSRVEHAARIAREPTLTKSFSELNNFAPPPVSFGRPHNPGFSTYPAPGLHDQLYDELRQSSDHSGWASAEGTNVRIGRSSEEEKMESYLARHFNHGASLVNLFGWGMGAQADPYRRATESAESIAAYRKFLAGQSLKLPVTDGLAQRVQAAQDRLIEWLRAGGDAKEAEPLLEEMLSHLRANRPTEAQAAMDRLLALIEQSP